MRILILPFFFLFIILNVQAQLNVQIKSSLNRVCTGTTLNLQDSIVSGTPSSYSWISNVASFSNVSSNTTLATFTTSGNVILKTDDGTNIYFDTLYVKVDTLPTISFTSNTLTVCCDYGTIVLNDLITSSVGGNWSCHKEPNWVSNNQFYVDSACGFMASNTYAKYTLQDTNTGCFNSDSLRITVRPLPNIIVKEGDFCQYINEINLKNQFVISPVTFIGTPSWKCVDCNGNDFSKMLINRGSGGITDYRLDVSKATYTFKNAQKDTIKLEFEYTDAYGCKNRDTVSFRLWRVPEITFSSYRDLCWNEGKISLNTLYGVNITGGRWEVYDTLGFRLPSQLGGINGDTINTLSSVPLANENVIPFRWFLRYIHTSSGCPSLKDTILLIFPSPKITLTDFDRSPPMYCENERPIPLEAIPSGGLWSSSFFNAVVNDSLQPTNVSLYNQDIQLFYNYTSPTTGCSSIDSIKAIIQPMPSITGWSDTSFGVKNNQTVFEYPIPIILKNNSSFFSVITNPSSTKNADLKFTQLNDTTWNLRLNQLVFDSCDMFRIMLAPGGIGACPDIEKSMELNLCWKDAASSNDATSNEIVQVYPNPSNGVVHFSSKISGDIHIYDSRGRLIYHDSLIGQSELELEDSGVYSILFTSANTQQTWIKRLIIVK